MDKIELRGRLFMTSAALGGGRGVNQILVFADGKEGGEPEVAGTKGYFG